jgi:hypothetical protein
MATRKNRRIQTSSDKEKSVEINKEKPKGEDIQFHKKKTIDSTPTIKEYELQNKKKFEKINKIRAEICNIEKELENLSDSNKTDGFNIVDNTRLMSTYGEILNIEAEICNLGNSIKADKLKNDTQKKLLSNINNIDKELRKLSDSNKTDRCNFVDNVRLMLTYDAILNVEEYRVWIQNLSEKKRLKLKEAIIVHSEYQTHMMLMWDKRFRSRSELILNYNDYHPLVRYIANTAELNIVRDYLKIVDINNM